MDNAHLDTLINEWKSHANSAHLGHYAAGIFYERFFLCLGIPVIMLSALTGGSEVLGIIEKNVAGVISLCIAVLAGLQTFLKFSQRSERHRMAGARYGAIRRSLEEMQMNLSGDHTDEQEARHEVHDIKEQLDSLASESPELPSFIYQKYRGKST